MSKKRVQTEFLEPGFTVEEDDWKGFIDKYGELVSNADVITISGSVPKGLDSKAYKDLINIGKKAGKKVILDTSGKLLEESVEAIPYMIKPNIDEIRMLTGEEIDLTKEDSYETIARAAKVLHEKGIKIVVVSLGADGSMMVCDDGVYRAIVPRIDAVNTVGCGDSMIAGFALGMSENLSCVDTLKKASAISAASAMTEETGRFRVEDMEALYEKIQIEKRECFQFSFS